MDDQQKAHAPAPLLTATCAGTCPLIALSSPLTRPLPQLPPLPATAKGVLARLSSTSQSLGEAVGHASRYLPTLSLRRRGSGAAADAKPAPPPLAVWVQLLSDEQQLVEVPASASLEELQLECEQATGVPPELQRLCVQGALELAAGLS